VIRNYADKGELINMVNELLGIQQSSIDCRGGRR